MTVFNTIIRGTVLAWVVMTGLAAAATAEVTLTQKYPEDSSHTYQMQVLVEQKLTLGEQSLDTKNESRVTLKTSYGTRDEQQRLPVATTFASIQSKLQLPGGVTVEFDSDKPDAESDNPLAQILIDTLKKQSGTTLKYSVGKDGTVSDVSGLPEGALVSAKSLQREFQQAANVFPDEPVEVGDTWRRTTQSDVGNGQLFTIKRQYEYQGTVPEFPTLADSRKLEKIRVTAESVEFTIDPDGGLPLKVEKSDLRIASSDGTILFDRQTGRIVSQTDEIRIQGDLALGAAGMNLEGRLDLTMKTKTTEER